MPYLGNSNSVQNFTPAVDYFNGNGSTTSFTLSRTVGSAFDVQAFIENVPQNPSSAFTVASNVITFTSAPPSGTNNIYVRYTSPVVQQVKPAPGTVSPTEINSAYSLWNLSGSDINYTAGNVGIGTASPDGLITLPATASNTPKIRLQSATSDVDVTITSYADSSGTYAAFGSNFYLNSSGDEAVFDSAKRSSFVRVDGRSQGAVIFGTATSGVPSERMRITSTGNVGIGTTSPAATLDVGSSVARSGAAQNNIYADYRITAATTGVVSSFASRIVGIGGSTYTIPDAAVYKADPIVAQTGVTITNAYGLYIGNMSDPISGGSVTNPWGIYQATSGNKNYFAGTLFIGATSSPTGTQRLVLTANGGDGIEHMLFNELRSTSATENYVRFYRNGSQVGGITNTLSATAYVTSSDYRLKENIAPMTGALDKVALLKPVTYTWKATGEAGQGFIAHELQEVISDAVSGEKDAVDEEGNIKPQGIDTSFLVATLTAAIQEQQTIIEDLKARIEVLEDK